MGLLYLYNLVDVLLVSQSDKSKVFSAHALVYRAMEVIGELRALADLPLEKEQKHGCAPDRVWRDLDKRKIS